ncbi:Vomeronasal type-1 receptor 90 [Sciurus carolinensis]|uniref:Vomeronasal type-1 receptor n=1 Tax=Sciurus carolinensis TaxID=30640 RepID=A0AA41MW54_SCICA|nr:Vomeronasal type-1 receptor 90 [Sciurus carolinensis]
MIPLLRYAFFYDVVLRISDNTILLFHNFTFFLQHRLKPTDLTIGHPAPSCLEMLLIMKLIATDVLLSQDLEDDIKCKSLIYLHRLLRGFSICATCQQIVPQMINLNPRNSCLANLKHKSTSETMFLIFLWVFYMSEFVEDLGFWRVLLLIFAIALLSLGIAYCVSGVLPFMENQPELVH